MSVPVDAITTKSSVAALVELWSKQTATRCLK
jgi:hypothetical protein